MDYRQKFIAYYGEHISRDGSGELLSWLQSTDFFTAPASTKYHCAYEGGLCEHSVHVFEVLRDKHMGDQDPPESFAIAALLHDVCKAGYYTVSERNVKNDATGLWEKKPYYAVDDKFPYGHGEKSVYLIERHMRLRPNEATAIRWHMGGFDDAARGGSFAVSQAFERYPLCVKLHLADLEATYLVEHHSRNSAQ